jgi:hypothetical protein
MRHLVSAAALAAMLLAACSESSTAPEISTPENGTPAPGAPSFSATMPGTNVTITSASCTQISTVTGEVRCDYDVSNPDGIMINIYPEARMNLEYQCVSPSTGKVQSTGTAERWAYAGFEGVTAIHPTGTNVKLSTATVPNTYVKKYNKLNACRGKQILVLTKSTMVYWDAYVDNWYIAQPGDQYKWTCLGSDDRYGCETGLVP